MLNKLLRVVTRQDSVLNSLRCTSEVRILHLRIMETFVEPQYQANTARESSIWVWARERAGVRHQVWLKHRMTSIKNR